MSQGKWSEDQNDVSGNGKPGRRRLPPLAGKPTTRQGPLPSEPDRPGSVLRDVSPRAPRVALRKESGKEAKK